MTEIATADALIDAALGRFATDGFDGASLRAVMRDANADPGSVHYHFGDRESLVEAVLDRVLRPLNRQRLRLLYSAVSNAAEAAPSVEELIEAIVRPDVETATALNQSSSGRGRLIGMIYLDRATFVQDEVAKHFGPVAERFMPYLIRAIPDVPGHVLSWRVRWFVFGVLGALLADEDALVEVQPEELIARLVCAGSAALSTPVSEEE